MKSNRRCATNDEHINYPLIMYLFYNREFLNKILKIGQK